MEHVCTSIAALSDKTLPLNWDSICVIEQYSMSASAPPAIDSEDESMSGRASDNEVIGSSQGTLLASPVSLGSLHSQFDAAPSVAQSPSLTANLAPRVHSSQLSRKHLSHSQRLRRDADVEQVSRAHVPQMKSDVQRQCLKFLMINDLDILSIETWSAEQLDAFNTIATDCGYYWQTVIEQLKRLWRLNGDSVYEKLDIALEAASVPHVPTVANTKQQAVRLWMKSTGPKHYIVAVRQFDFDVARRHFTQ